MPEELFIGVRCSDKKTFPMMCHVIIIVDKIKKLFPTLHIFSKVHTFPHPQTIKIIAVGFVKV